MYHGALTFKGNLNVFSQMSDQLLQLFMSNIVTPIYIIFLL